MTINKNASFSVSVFCNVKFWKEEFAKNGQILTGVYYLHSDHLGTASYVTNEIADPTQFFLNLPFGETMIEQQEPTAYVNPYKFNAKELDNETGLYYYGARYYNPRISIWYGVDPLAEMMRRHSPYNYVFNNPINFVDPDGMAPLTDYKLLKNGNIERVNSKDETDKDSTDTLYATHENGNVDKSKGSVSVKKQNGTSVIGDLVKPKGKSSSGTDMNYTSTNRILDALDIFQFAALNSVNEWSFEFHNNESQNSVIFGTNHEIDGSPDFSGNGIEGFGESSLIYDIHSHAALNGTNGPSQSLIDPTQGDMAYPRTSTHTRYLFRANGSNAEKGNLWKYGKGTPTPLLVSPNKFLYPNQRLSKQIELIIPQR